jgi:putative flippase GtrA
MVAVAPRAALVAASRECVTTAPSVRAAVTACPHGATPRRGRARRGVRVPGSAAAARLTYARRVAAAVVTALQRVHDGLGHLVRELLKFGMVGIVAFAVDVGLFNLLLHQTDKPLTSKTISTVVATTVAYIGNRLWTFRRRSRSGVGREYSLFFLLNGVGLAISLGCLATSHYLLGFTGRLADNIAANVVGLAMGTAFRFWSYRRFVFRAVLPEATPPGAVEHAGSLSGDLLPPR